jgi:hypothetical protein
MDLRAWGGDCSARRVDLRCRAVGDAISGIGRPKSRHGAEDHGGLAEGRSPLTTHWLSESVGDTAEDGEVCKGRIARPAQVIEPIAIECHGCGDVDGNALVGPGHSRLN